MAFFDKVWYTDFVRLRAVVFTVAVDLYGG